MDDPNVTAIWRAERRHLIDIAFRMLGDVREAEDVVQEAFARLVRAGVDTVDDPRGWLTVVVGRLCLDTMRSARVRHEARVGGDWPGETAAPPTAAAQAPIDPADRITLDDTVRLAMYVVLERLSPAERTAFVLHDVFQFDFETVASIVGRTPAACRQLASRARRHIAGTTERGWIDVEPSTHRLVTERFIGACAGGDLQGLMEVLDPDVGGEGTPGGFVPRFRPVVGAAPVARNLLRLFGPDSGATLVSMAVRGQPAVLATIDHQIAAVLVLDVDGDRIRHIHAVGDPSGLMG